VTDYITPRQFIDAEGVEDWRLLSEGALALFRTGSFGESASLVSAGGRMVRDESAPAWGTLADPAGKEADIATVTGRS
jgi:hypothetical protein